MAIGLICACMPTFNRLYQSHKKPEEAIKPAPWAFGVPTPKFLKRSKPRRARWSAAMSSTLEPNTQADEEALVTTLSELKPTASPTGQFSTDRPQTFNKQITWGQHPSSKSSAPSTITFNSSKSSSKRGRSTLASRSTAQSLQSRDQSPQRGVVDGPGSHELSVISTSTGPAVYGVRPSLPEWPPPRMPQRLAVRSPAESVEPSRILNPPPWHRRRSEQERLDRHTQ